MLRTFWNKTKVVSDGNIVMAVLLLLVPVVFSINVSVPFLIKGNIISCIIRFVCVNVIGYINIIFLINILYKTEQDRKKKIEDFKRFKKNLCNSKK